jgi:hypothetical protein
METMSKIVLWFTTRPSDAREGGVASDAVGSGTLRREYSREDE